MVQPLPQFQRDAPQHSWLQEAGLLTASGCPHLYGAQGPSTGSTHPPRGLSSLPPPSAPFGPPQPVPERASMDGNSQQLWTPMESVAQLYQRFSKMVLVVMTFPCTVDTLQLLCARVTPSVSSPTAVRKKPKVSTATGMVGHRPRGEPGAPETGRGWAPGEPKGAVAKEGGPGRRGREREAGRSLGLFRGPGPSPVCLLPSPQVSSLPRRSVRGMSQERTAAVDEEMEGINQTGQKSTPAPLASGLPWAPRPSRVGGEDLPGSD